MKEQFLKRKLHIIWLLIAAALVGLDRLTKWLVTSNMKLFDSVSIIRAGDTEVLNIYYCLNKGAAFSSLSGQTALLIVFTSVVIASLLFLMITGKVRRPVYVAALGLVIGGGIGNLIDRIFNNGCVIDFIDFRIINFPVFNFADICAVCGAGLVLLTIVIDEIREFRKKRKKTSEDGSNGKA